jgi:putative transposase
VKIFGHRKRLRRFEVAQQPRFLTFSCYQGLPLLRNDLIKREFVEHLRAAREHCGFRLLAWVVMPEHVHVILIPRLPEMPLTKVLPSIKRRMAEQVIHRWKQLNAPVLRRLAQSRGGYRFWQHGGGYDRNIRDESELWAKMDYIHMNPVNRELCARPTDYCWSSARWYSDMREADELEMDSIW